MKSEEQWPHSFTYKHISITYHPKWLNPVSWGTCHLILYGSIHHRLYRYEVGRFFNFDTQCDNFKPKLSFIQQWNQGWCWLRSWRLHLPKNYRCDDVFRCPRVDCQEKTQLCFPAVKQRLILALGAQKSAYLNQINVRKPLVISISQKREDLRLYGLV